MTETDIVNALTATVPLELHTAQTGLVAGAPSSGSVVLGILAGSETGVWEITPGVVTDTEVEEIFIVLRGAAVVDLLDGGDPLHLTAGSVGSFAAGTRTRWTVTETLRKIYVVRAEES